MNTTDDYLKNEKGKAARKRTRILVAVLVYACAFLAIGCLIGIIVAVMILNFGKSENHETLSYILVCSFAGGAAVFGLAAFFLSRALTAAAARELDFRERCDGEESFFVGEGTLMTFEAEGVRLHDERGSEHEPIRVPYSEMRFISVCTRKKAQEKGDWCVAVEIPLKYLAKKGAKKTGEPVLVQADAKPRLYQTLEKHGLALLGEQPPAEKVKTNCKFKPVKNFSLPNRAKRRRALVFIVISALLIVAAVPVGIFYSVSICSVLAAAGLLLGGKSVYSCIRAKAVFGVYLEGFFWQESSGSERLFLKWQDVESVTRIEHKGFPLIEFRCSYGKYTVPCAEGAYELVDRVRGEHKKDASCES